MTIQSESIKAGPFDGNGVTTVFAFNFKTFAEADLRVIYTDTYGVESDLVLDSDYSVSLNADQETSPGGTVTYPLSGSPLAVTEKLTILNEVDFLQGLDLQNGGEWNPQTLENALDLLTILVQRNREAATRGLRVPPSDETTSLTLPTKTTRASAFLAFDADGEPIASAGGSSVPVSTFMATVVDALTALEARTDLRAGGVFLSNSRPDPTTLREGDIWLDADYGAPYIGVYLIRSPLLPALDALLHVIDGTTGDVLPRGKHISQIQAVVVSNALTLTTKPQVFDFRSSTLTNGLVTTAVSTSDLSITVPDGATLGTVANQQARLVKGVLNDGGTLRPFVINLAGGVDLSETGVISATAISAAADSANVAYSTASVTDAPYYLTGFIDITEAVAGTWATAPTLVQGAGGNALTAMQSLGYGQTYQDVTGSRAYSTTYYNTTGRPIRVFVTGTNTTGSTDLRIFVNGIRVDRQGQGTATLGTGVTAIVPPGASYYSDWSAGTPSLTAWVELR